MVWVIALAIYVAIALYLYILLLSNTSEQVKWYMIVLCCLWPTTIVAAFALKLILDYQLRQEDKEDKEE
jgi:hypothetical protein